MANGWTAERKARQSELIRNWKPWERSTGPKTSGGKMRSSQNALLHGAYSQEAKKEEQKLSLFLRECRNFLRSRTDA